MVRSSSVSLSVEEECGGVLIFSFKIHRKFRRGIILGASYGFLHILQIFKKNTQEYQRNMQIFLRKLI